MHALLYVFASLRPSFDCRACLWLLTCVLCAAAASAGAVRSPSLHSQFPGTGDLKDDGVDKGKYYAVNFPLNDGIDDKTYLSVFKPVCLPTLASPRRSPVRSVLLPAVALRMSLGSRRYDSVVFAFVRPASAERR